MNIQALALAFLAFTAMGGVAWVFLYPLLSGERKAESRRASVASPEPVARSVDKNTRTRREQVEGSLKDLDARRQKDKKVSLGIRLTQARLDWTPRKLIVISAVLGLVTFAAVFVPSRCTSVTLKSNRFGTLSMEVGELSHVIVFCVSTAPDFQETSIPV